MEELRHAMKSSHSPQTIFLCAAPPIRVHHPFALTLGLWLWVGFCFGLTPQASDTVSHTKRLPDRWILLQDAFDSPDLQPFWSVL